MLFYTSTKLYDEQDEWGF